MGNPGGSTGLPGQWGVNPPGQNQTQSNAPADTGSDQQKLDFQAAFQSEQGVINDHLQYTSANAEAAKHAPLAARRDALYTAFQSALASIDRNNPAKAQPFIDKVLGDARALSGEVATFRQQAEKDKNDWDERQARYDQVVHKVEELEAWEDPKAAALRGLVDGIRTYVNQRQYAKATSTLEQLEPKLEPIYEEYLRQKEAKPKYEAQLAEQTARLEPLKAAERPSQPMTAKAGEADTALEGAKAKAQERDFVAGLEQMQTVQATVDELDQMTNDPERAKFLADIGGIDQIVQAPEGTVFQTQEADWSAITTQKEQIAPAGDGGDYAGANQMMAELKEKVEAFKAKHDELEQAKADYEAALAEVQPRMTEASALGAQPQYAKLQPQIDELASAQDQATAAADAEDFTGALTQVQDLSGKLDAIDQAKAEIDAKKQEYETALAALQPRLQATSTCEPEYAKLEPQQQAIVTGQSEMEAAAQAGDYDKAIELAADLGGKLDEYEAAKAEIDEKKQEYETTLATLQPRLDAIASCETKYAKLEPQQQAIDAAQTDMEAAAKAGDYDKANEVAADLGGKLDDYETAKAEIDQQKTDYETALAELKPRLDAVSNSDQHYAKLEPMQQELTQAQTTMEASATSGDYEAANTQLDEVRDKLEALEDARKELDQARQDYESAMAELKPRLDKALAPATTKTLNSARTAVEQGKTTCESAATANDYEDALKGIDALKTALDDFEAAAEALEKSKTDYEKLLTTLQPRLAKAGQTELTDEKLKAERDNLLADQKSMEASAQVGDWDEALTTANDLNKRLDAFEKAAGGGGMEHSFGGEVSIAEFELGPPLKGAYVKAQAKLGAAVKFGPAGDPPADTKTKKEDVEKDVLSKAKEVLTGGKWEMSDSLKVNPKERSVSLAVAPTYVCEWGPVKGELAPVEISLIGWDKKSGSLSGPKATVLSVTLSYKNGSMQITVSDVKIEFAVAGSFGIEISPDYAAIGEWILKTVTEEVLTTMVEGIVLDAAALASAAAVVALPAAAAVAIGFGMYQESRNMAADSAAIATALPARKKAEQVAKAFASTMCGGGSGGGGEGAANAEAQIKQIMDKSGATREQVQEAVRKAQGGYDGVMAKELQRIKDLMFAEACRNFDEGHKSDFGFLENRGPDWGYRGSFRKTLRIVLFN